MPEMRAAGRFVVAADHPCLAGHFPGRPVVPGVVLLEEALACLPAGTLTVAKFLRPVLPGEAIEVAWDGAATFVCASDGVAVLRGGLRLPP